MTVSSPIDAPIPALRGTKGRRPAAHRRAAPSPAIWSGWTQSCELFGFGRDKSRDSAVRSAAPRPGAARRVTETRLFALSAQPSLPRRWVQALLTGAVE